MVPELFYKIVPESLYIENWGYTTQGCLMCDNFCAPHYLNILMWF